MKSVGTLISHLMLGFLLGFSLQARFHRHHVSIDCFMFSSSTSYMNWSTNNVPWEVVYEGYNTLICCIRKLYILIAYLITPYGNTQEYSCQAPLFVAAYHRIDYLSLKDVLAAFWADKNSSVCLLLSVVLNSLIPVTAKPSSKRDIRLKKITIALHVYSRKPQTNVIPSFYSNKENQVFTSLRASAD